jgi:ribosomal-protein-alanine N-acetyltransferase
MVRHPGVVLIDAPAANPEAEPLLQQLGFEVVGQTLRMFRGLPPAVRLGDVYGVACLELG